MTRVILPVRSRLSRPTSSASRGNTLYTSASQAASSDAISDGPAETNNNASNPIVSEENNEGCQTPIPSIERSPSPTFTATTELNISPVLTPSRTPCDVLERNNVPHTARETNSSPTFTFVGRRAPTPSVSISPPPSLTTATRSSVGVSDIGSTGLTSSLQDMGLLSGHSSPQPRAGLDMTEIGAAIDDLAQDVGTPRPNGSLVVLTPGNSRRRSSPRPEPVIHRVEDEEPPDDEFHSLAFQQRLSQAKNMLQGLARVLSSSPIHIEPDSNIKRHHEEAESLGDFHPLSTRRVGLVGDSGVGKSSLINSLLDKDSLARTTGRGSACTCVVTEYHFHAADNFIIDVDMFTEDELCEQIAELLASYRAFHSDVETESKEKADIAINTFKSMFRGKLQNEAWILDESEDIVLDCFKTWAKQARRLVSPGRQPAQTLDECSSLLVPLSSEPNNPRQSSMWPYIRKVKVYLKAHILSKGLVLVDLPGLRDLNSARRNITQQNIFDCHEIFAICRIIRAGTDEGVKAVFDLARQARLERVGIICTYADEVNFIEIPNDWEHGEARRIKELDRSLKAVQSQIEGIRAELATFDYLPSEDTATQQEKLALLEENMMLENRRNVIKFELLESAVRTRNSHVTQALRTAFQAQARGETLHVFCVSNQMYQEKRNLDKSVSGKYLSLSGIIDVRRHFIAAVGESQLRASKNFLEHNVPALLRDIELWVQSGAGSASAEEKQAVTRVLGRIEKTLEKGLTSRRSPVETIKRSLDNSFETRIWQGRQISKWTQSSKDACEDWDEWAPNSYAAWLRNDGEHRTSRPYCNWNKEVMKDMITDIESPWDDLLSDIRVHQVHLKQDIVACFEKAIADLGLSSSRFLIRCSASSRPLPVQNPSGLIPMAKLTRLAEPSTSASICCSTGQRTVLTASKTASQICA
ncbi:hypothetical protein FJTKL_07151 [Diaporthe vaccinii]|uniref:Tat pathway signal sequence n=1 Tax=Diaporthe vaccinii TaxID=105482 RepID=A0ABR4EVE5_9PEZI